MESVRHLHRSWSGCRSRNVNGEEYILLMVARLVAGETYNYTVRFQLLMVNNSTRVALFVFSEEYIAGKVMPIRTLPETGNLFNNTR